jgi:hypothetical protein
MMVKVSGEQAAARRQRHVTPNGAMTHISTYMGTNAMELAAQGKSKDEMAGLAGPYPMAYLVDQAADCTVEAHYHQVDQFQLFVGGSGHIGTHPVESVTVHYAGAHSPYGPIVSGPAGVRYVTLRRSWDPGAQWMPGAAPRLRAMPGRKHVAATSQPFKPMSGAQLATLEGVSFTEVIAQPANGSGAWLVRAGPGAAVRADPSGSAGQFWYVLGGGLQEEESQLGVAACIFVSGDEKPFEFAVGASGAELVLMQFPAS